MKCGKEAQESEFCNSCFPEIMTKRIRKSFKIDLKKDRKLLVFDRLSEVVVKDILKGSKVEVIRKPFKDFDVVSLDEGIFNNKKLNNYNNKNNIDITVLPWTADDEIDGFFIGLFGKDIKRNNDNRFIKLFKSLTNEELSRYARIKGIKTEDINKNNEFIEKLAKKYPDIKHSTLKSIEELDEIRQKRKENR